MSKESIRRSQEALARAMGKRAAESDSLAEGVLHGATPPAEAPKPADSQVLHAVTASSAVAADAVGARSGQGAVRTAPGAVAQFMTQRSEVHKRNEELEARLRTFEGALPVRRLNPELIVRSDLANRDERSFSGAQWTAFVEEISLAGGNVQPIKVRPLEGGARITPYQPGGPVPEFEIVYGHRRHQACMELGIPVLAIDQALTDVEMFAQMDRENRGRENITAWELGVSYSHALSRGLFPSLRQMAVALGVDPGYMSRAMAVAQLPESVVTAFASPLDIQFRTPVALKAAMNEDAEGLLERARQVAAEQARLLEAGSRPLGYAQVMSALVPGENKPDPMPLAGKAKGDKLAATLRMDASGRKATVAFKRVLSPQEQVGLAAAISRYLEALD